MIAGTAVGTTTADAASPTGHKHITVSLTASNKIKVHWGATTGVKYYKVRTSSVPDFSEDIKTWKVAKGTTTKWIDATASRYFYARPGSGNYIFVRVYAVKSNGSIGVSPYKRVKLHSPAAPANAQRLTVATFNVRTATEDVKGHSWASRDEEVGKRINEAHPDVVAVQEAGDHGDNWVKRVDANGNGYRDYYWQFEDLRDKVGGNYQLVDDQEYSTGSGKEGTRILYDASKFRVLNHGVFAPSAVNKYLRYVPWALFQNVQTGEQFYFISVHLDNRSGAKKYYDLRIKQIDKIIDVARGFKATGHQVILAGDLNSNIYSEPNNGVDYKLLKAGFWDAYATSKVTYPYRVTYNGYKSMKKSASRTDYIFTFGGPKGSYAYKNWITKVGGEWPSDHNLQSASVPY